MAYYGGIDATPLFVMLLGEFANWTVGADSDGLDGRCASCAGSRLPWTGSCSSGDKDGDGFLEYERCERRRLMNTRWKDSWNGITFADGRIARPPIALAEVQGYAYAAASRGHAWPGSSGDTCSAADWTQRANAAEGCIQRTVLARGPGWYALGLDRHKRPIDSLASNMGHCLGQQHHRAGARFLRRWKLLSPELFSGWGSALLASSMAAYNPMSSERLVWRHDDAICAAGLLRYSLVEARTTGRVGGAGRGQPLRAHRLPELYCGFDRREYPGPVPFRRRARRRPGRPRPRC